MAQLGSGMKRVAILVGLILTLILAGAGETGRWFFSRHASAQENAKTEESAEAEEPAAEDPVDSIRSFGIEPIVLPILQEGRVILHLTLVLKVEFSGPEDKGYIKKMKPRLRDSLIKTLHGIMAFKHINARDEIAPIVRERLRKAGNDVFGPGRVKAVLVQAMSRRVPGEG